MLERFWQKNLVVMMVEDLKNEYKNLKIFRIDEGGGEHD